MKDEKGDIITTFLVGICLESIAKEYQLSTQNDVYSQLGNILKERYDKDLSDFAVKNLMGSSDIKKKGSRLTYSELSGNAQTKVLGYIIDFTLKEICRSDIEHLKSKIFANSNSKNFLIQTLNFKLFNGLQYNNERKRFPIVENISTADKMWLYSTIPSSFFNSYVRSEKEPHFGLSHGQSKYVSDIIDFQYGNEKTFESRSEIASIISKTHSNFTQNFDEKVNEVYIMHALSPNEDMLFLLLELGRFMRISHSLKVKNTHLKIKIYCADESWSSYNQTVNYISEKFDWSKNIIEDKLRKNKSKRALIYSRLSSAFGPTENNYFVSTSQLNAESIEKDSMQYVEFSNQDRKNDFSRIIRDYAKANKFVKNLRDKFVNSNKDEVLEPEIVKYVLFQREWQKKIPNSLKVAILREFDFDETFYDLNLMDEKSQRPEHQYGIYFKDYHLKIPDSKNPMKFGKFKCHPYFWPSSASWNDKNSPGGSYYRLNKKDLESKITTLEKYSILLSDYRDKDKINRILNYYTLEELSTIMCDLFSFAYYFLHRNELIPIVQSCGFDEEVENAFSMAYASDGKRADIFVDYEESILSIEYASSKPPFYVFPFIYALPDLIDRKQRIVDSYVEFTFQLLVKINEKS